MHWELAKAVWRESSLLAQGNVFTTLYALVLATTVQARRGFNVQHLCLLMDKKG